MSKNERSWPKKDGEIDFLFSIEMYITDVGQIKNII